MLKRINYLHISLFFIAVISATFLVGAVEKGYCINVAVTDITPSSVGIDKDFTVGILIDNCGEKIPENITFRLKNISPYISVKEPLTTEIGKMGYANSKRFLLYHMRTSKKALPGTYSVGYEAVYGREGFIETKEGTFSITVIGKEAEIGIASVKTKPVLPIEGDTVELTLRIENVGEGTAKSVEVCIDHSFQGLKQSFIGALDSDEDGPAILTFVVDKPGEFEFPVRINYKDDFGDNEINTKINLSVLEKKSNILNIVLVVVIILIIAGLIFQYFKTKKAKDRIIQQLLKGNNNEKNKMKKK